MHIYVYKYIHAYVHTCICMYTRSLLPGYEEGWWEVIGSTVEGLEGSWETRVGLRGQGIKGLRD
jgi:hypothetical protein